MTFNDKVDQILREQNQKLDEIATRKQLDYSKLLMGSPYGKFARGLRSFPPSLFGDLFGFEPW